MSLASILNTATSALGVNQQALRTTSNNIANVNTPGYVRQRVDLQASVAGSQPNGVEISGIARVTDKFLEAASWSAKSDAAQYDALAKYYDRFDSILGDPNDNNSIPGKLDQLYSSLNSLALDPTAAGSRQSALASIDSFTRTVSNMASQIQDLRAEVSGQIGDIVTEINSALQRIAELNPKIVSEKATNGGDASSLEEQRAQAINDLSELVDIRVNTNPDGSVRVSTTSGTALVDITPYVLTYDPPGTVTSGTLFEPITLHTVDPSTGTVIGSGATLDSGVLSGELRGLLDMRDTVLPDLGTELGNLARAAMDQFNAVHNASTAYPPPHSLTGTQTGMLGTDATGFSGIAHFSVTDGSGNLVNSVAIDFSAYATLDDAIAAVNAGLGGAGTLTLDDGVMSFTASDPANGVVIVQDEANPSDRAGHGFSQFFGMNDLLVSDTPSNYATGITGSEDHGFAPGGTMNLKLRGPDGKILVDYDYTVTSGDFDSIVNDLNSSPLGPYMTFSLNADGGLDVTPTTGAEGYKLFVPSDTTDRGGTGVTISRFFGLGEAYSANSANGLSVSDAIAEDNRRLALAQYNQSAAPGEPVVAAGDGRGAQTLADLQNKSMDFDSSGTLNSMQVTLSQYASAFLSNTAQAGNTVHAHQQDTQALSLAVDEKLSNATGVNLDEELSNLLVYQNAYNAAARIVTTAKEMMDTLLGMMN